MTSSRFHPCLLAVVLLGCCVLLAGCSAEERADDPAVEADTPAPPPEAPAPEIAASTAEARRVVEQLGARMKNVSLLAPRATVEPSMRENYAELVDPDLLERWIEDPSTAPGRAVSSPWPERIEVENARELEAERIEVTGSIVEMTSEAAGRGESGRIPVRAVLGRRDGRWVITSWESGVG